jgi:hypothetical protein
MGIGFDWRNEYRLRLAYTALQRHSYEGYEFLEALTYAHHMLERRHRNQ